ncbi:STP1 protein [Plasmodium ovale]|uniref:STP1 protein n=1 Tax=Plasmodium ovale TaxID=36330 RepID=A0A1D3JCP9_PLAOA|nr:STP1 protein [Plasmodium ovale]
MGDYSGYTTNLRDVDIGLFLAMIKSDIKKLIHTYGHKNCGLRHEELCKEIKQIIFQNKKIVFNFMDAPGKQKWSNEWESRRIPYFNKLFQEEGFINVCYPLKEKGSPNLQKLKSKYIQFCKEKDERRSAVGNNPEYSVCRQYNSWIIKETASFTSEFLKNVRDSNISIVKKYFSTKEHPRGHDPLGTYRNSKLDCEIYNPTSRSYPQIPIANRPTDKPQPSMEPNIIRDSQGKDVKSVTHGDSASAKTNPGTNNFPNAKAPIVDSQSSSPSKTQPDDIPTAQDTPVKLKDPVSPVNVEGAKKESTTLHHQLPTGMPHTIKVKESPKDSILSPLIRHQPSPTATTTSSSTLATVKDTTSSQTTPTSPSLTTTSASSLDSVSPLPSDLIPSAAVTNDHDRASHLATTSDTLATTHSTQTLPSLSASVFSLAQPQPPALNTPPAVIAAQGPGTPVSSSSSTVTATVTTTTMSPVADTKLTMSTKQETISSIKQVPRVPGSQEPSPSLAAGEPKATVPTTEPQQTITQTPTPLIGSHTGGVSDPTQPEHKDTKPKPGAQLTNDISQTSGQKTDNVVVAADVKLLRTINQTDSMRNISPDHTGISRDHDQLTHHVNADLGKIPSVKQGKDLNNNSVTQNRKNDNPNIIPEGITPLKHIIPTLLDLKRIFEIPEKRTYEYPNITVHEWEDPNLVKQTVENDVYIKLLKINRYKQEMQKRKKKKKTTLIEVHMEIFEEYKKDEWELHKGDFLEICLRGFINEENETYQKFANSELILNNIKNEKTIENIQKQQHLWNSWIENHRNILEEWKKDEWFLILKNEWRKEKNIYQEKNHNLKENILNEPETHSIVSQKDIWKQWISKQATLIKTFNEEDWFKALVDEQNKEKDNYGVKYNDNAIVTNINGSENENSCNKPYERKKIIEKLMVQIHMMVLEECIKEDIMRNKEISIDNYIKSINNKNNYEQKSYIPECASDGFNVSEFKEINTYVNK